MGVFVELIDPGDKKIFVIELIRKLTGKNLKEAKELIDNVPSIILNTLNLDEANDIKKKFEELGAIVNLR